MMNTGRLRGAGRRAGLAHERRVEAGDEPIDELGKALPPVLRAVALGQLVGAPVLRERIRISSDIVVVLAERIAQADFRSKGQRPRQERFDRFAPRGVVRRHLPVGGDARVSGRIIAVEGDGLLEQLLGLGKSAAIGLQLAQERQGFDIAGVDGQRGATARFRLGGPALLAQGESQAQMRRGMSRLQRQRAAVARHRFVDSSQFKQDCSNIAVALGAAGVELGSLGILGQGLEALPAVAQQVAQDVMSDAEGGVQGDGLPDRAERLIGAAQVPLGVAEIAVDLRITGPQSQRASIACRRLVVPAQLEQGIAEVVVGLL